MRIRTLSMAAVCLTTLCGCVSLAQDINGRNAANHEAAGRFAEHNGDWQTARLQYAQALTNARLAHAGADDEARLSYEYDRVLAITSLTHTRAVPAGHPSGRKLADLADVVLDNRAPRGDALLDLPGGGAVCALSTLTGVMLVQMAVAEASRILLDSGERPPVYVSANVPGGFEGNLELEKRYAGRIRRTAS